MALAKTTSKVSVEEYLEGEKISEIRHEYVNGEVYTMSGTNRRHNIIASNAHGRLRSHLRGGECQSYIVDVKVYVAAHNSFYYPDVVVTCDPQDNDEYIIKQPRLIVEILSPSTEMTDRREKLFAYQKIESLIEYIIIEQDKVGAIRYFRNAQGQWLKEELAADEVLTLESVELRFSLAELYEDVL